MIVKGLEPDTSTPQMVIGQFLDAWASRDWKKMEECSQISWMNIIPDPREMLKAMFSYKPLSIEVTEKALLNNVTFAAMLKIRYLIARSVEKECVLQVRVLCEEGPMLPSAKGTWGVNPTTMVLS